MFEWLAPARLGRDFRLLFAGSVASQLGDGIWIVAGPLLVASLTRDPFLVAATAAIGQAPWLLFSLLVGGVVDRARHVPLFVTVNLIRVAALTALAVAIGVGRLSVPLVMVVTFVLGTAEVVSDTIATTLPPLVVPDRADYGLANARLIAVFLIFNTMVGPPIAAVLFSWSRLVPVVAAAGCLAITVAVFARLNVPHEPAERRHLLREVQQGLGWSWRNKPVRTLMVLIAGFNITFGAAWGLLVLLAAERLGLSSTGYGLFLATGAVGGVLGSALYPRLELRFGLTTLMRAGLILETLTHLAFAVLTQVWAASLVMFAFGMHGAIWGTTSTTLRQRLVPRTLYGRVNSLYLLCVFGSLVVGQAIGGLIAQATQLTGAYWFAFGGSALLTVALWQQMAHLGRSSEVHPDTGQPD